MSFNPEKPYNELPLLPPDADIETKAILKKCIDARSSMAALKQAGDLIPSQLVLINTIPLLEAQMSSEIENIVTTTDKLFQYVNSNSEEVDVATKETLCYRQALAKGCKLIKDKPICTRLAVELCSVIKNREMEIRKIPGTALSNSVTSKTVYTPPVGESVIREKMSNWERFINEQTEIDPLIRMAVMHYQFEAIHPFSDGNGRTGRLLNILYMVQEGILDIPVLYLSKYIINHKTRYYSLLRKVTETGDWENWILFMLDAIDETARWTTEKIKAIKMLMDHTCEFARSNLDKAYTKEMVELLFVQPYCRINNVIEAGLAKRQTASDRLKKYVAAGILREVKAGREVLFIHLKFIELLTSDENSFVPYKM